MKTIQEVVESSASVSVDPERVKIMPEDFAMPPGGCTSAGRTRR